MSIWDGDYYGLHRKIGNLYVTKGKQDGFPALTCVAEDEHASSPEQVVDNWVRSWHHDGPTSVTATKVSDGVWLVTYVVLGRLSAKEFLEKRAREWKEIADRTRESGSHTESLIYVKARILTQMIDIGYAVSDTEVRDALIKVDYPNFY